MLSMLVIDNDSGEEDYKKLKAFCNEYSSSLIKLDLIRNSKNVGYFAGLNVGLEKVKNIDEKTCIIGNNDVIFEADFLNRFEELEVPSDAIVVCPDIINRDGKHENPQLASRASTIMKLAFKVYFTSYLLSVLVFNASKIMKKLNLRKANTTFNNEQYIYQGSGACYILPKQFFKFYQRLDDEVFLWGEERLLANQVQQVDRKTWYTPLLKMYHNDSMSTSKVPSREAWKINRESYKIYRNYM